MSLRTGNHVINEFKNSISRRNLSQPMFFFFYLNYYFEFYIIEMDVNSNLVTIHVTFFMNY